MDIDLSWDNFEKLKNEFDNPVKDPGIIDEKTEEEEELQREIDAKLHLINSHKCCFCNEIALLPNNTDGEIYCMSCGKSNGDAFDMNQEYRGNCDDPGKTFEQCRVGMAINPNFPKSSLSTITLGRGYQKFREYERFQQMPYKERKLLKNFQKIDRQSEDAHIPSAVAEYAKTAFKKLSDDEKRRGEKVTCDMAACVYYTGMNRDCKKTKAELSKAFNISKKKLTKGCNHFKETIFFKEPEYYLKLKPKNEYSVIQEACVELNLEDKYCLIAQYIAFVSIKLELFIKITPASIASGSIIALQKIYGKQIDRQKLANFCQVSDVTVGKAYNRISHFLKILVPTPSLFKMFLDNYDKIIS